MSAQGAIIVVSAASGAGKTTLLDHVRAVVPNVVYSISCTTRPPRAHEVNGVHYHFLSPDEFKRRIEHEEFAEWQEVHGNYYGTPRRCVEETIQSGLHIVMDIDVYGKKKFDLVFPQAVGILILPPSLDALERRLRDRGTDAEDVIRVRLANARKEIDFARTEGVYRYCIVNSDLDKAKREVVDAVTEIIGSRS